MAREIKLRIVLEHPPKGVDFALQKGRGRAHETTQKQRSDGKDLTFEFTPIVKDGVSDPMAALSGAFIQGPRDQRFIYIDIGTLAGQVEAPWSRRLKIPLAGITMKMLRAGSILEARVPGTGRDGSPSCATVKEFEGWISVKN